MSSLGNGGGGKGDGRTRGGGAEAILNLKTIYILYSGMELPHVAWMTPVKDAVSLVEVCFLFRQLLILGGAAGEGCLCGGGGGETEVDASRIFY